MDWDKVGKRVKTLRSKAGLTQPEVATGIGMHRATVARLEGGGSVTEGTLYALASLFKVDIGEITGDPPSPTHAVSMGTGSGKTASFLAYAQQEHFIALTKDLVGTILAWEKLDSPSVPFGEILKVNVKAHRLLDELEGMESVEPTFNAEQTIEPPRAQAG